MSQLTSLAFSQEEKDSLEDYSLQNLLNYFSSPIEFCTKTKRVSYPYAYFISHQLSMVANQIPDVSNCTSYIMEYCQRLVVKMSREVIGIETFIISLCILKSRNESQFHFFSKIMYDIWSSKIMSQFNRKSKYLANLSIAHHHDISILDIGLCPYVILQLADFSNEWRNHVVTEITKALVATDVLSDNTSNSCNNNGIRSYSDPYLDFLICIMSDCGSLELLNFMTQWKQLFQNARRENNEYNQ